MSALPPKADIPALERPVENARSGWCLRILGLKPRLGQARAILRIDLFRDNALKAKFAGSDEHCRTIALDMLHVLNTALGAFEQLTQRSLALGEWFAVQVVAVEHQQIKSASHRSMIHNPAVKRVELCGAISIEPDHLCIDDCGAFNASGLFHNERIAARPVDSDSWCRASPALPAHEFADGSRRASARAPSRDHAADAARRSDGRAG
jgi:hypothetical protein